MDQIHPWVIRPVIDQDREWIKVFLEQEWGSSLIVTRGRIHQADQLAGLIIFEYTAGVEHTLGLLTYNIAGQDCEVVSLNSMVEGRGVGTQLLIEVEKYARAANCKRLWLITTNDNTHALRFYQRRGFQLAALHRGAIEHSRLLKPSISLLGIDDIPIRDEIELEKILT